MDLSKCFISIQKGWRTRDQIIQLQNGNVQLADSVIARKKSTGEFREHPDLPDDPAMTMYYVSRMDITGPILMILKSSYVTCLGFQSDTLKYHFIPINQRLESHTLPPKFLYYRFWST